MQFSSDLKNEKMKNWLLLSILLLVLTVVSCKKDVEEDIEATRMKLIDRVENLDVPEVMKNSSNDNAKTAVGYVDMVKGVANYFTWIEVPEDAQRVSLKSSDDVYFWSYGGVTVWETLTETSTAYKWVIEIDNGTGRKKYLESEEQKDGSYGIMKVYDEDGSTILFTYEWEFDAAGNGTILWKDASESFIYDVTVNVDNSGYAKWISEGVLIYHFLWNSDGSGSYSYYDTDGEVLLSENWDVEDL
jgi:hypothetical protein